QLLNNQGCVAGDIGDYLTARKLLQESLVIRRQLGDKGGLALSLNSLADVTLDEGDYDATRPLLEESLTINSELGDRAAVAYLLDDFAGLAAAQGRPARALQLAGAATALYVTVGAAISPAERARFDRMLEPARRVLDETEQLAAWEQGYAMT